MNARDMDSGSDTKIETDQNTNRDGDGKRREAAGNRTAGDAEPEAEISTKQESGVRVGPRLGPSSSGQDGIGG